MLDLCSASQQEYLGLPSIYEWQDKYYASKSKRRKQKLSKAKNGGTFKD